MSDIIFLIKRHLIRQSLFYVLAMLEWRCNVRAAGRVTIIVAHARHALSGVLNPIARRACREYLNGQFGLNASFESASIRFIIAVTREIVVGARQNKKAPFAAESNERLRASTSEFSERRTHCAIKQFVNKVSYIYKFTFASNLSLSCLR